MRFFQQKSSQQNPSVFEALEERVLFDAVPDADVVAPQSDAGLQQPAQVQNADQNTQQQSHELIVIDGSVANNQQLLSELIESRDDKAFSLLFLDNQTDGISQILSLIHI